jgi:hypothetical protein
MIANNIKKKDRHPLPQMIFEDRGDGRPRPRLHTRPIAFEVVVPNGEELLSLRQAYRHFNMPLRSLIEEWLCTWGGIIEQEELSEILRNSQCMIFSVGTRRYVVRRLWKLSCEGEFLQGLCDWTTRTIWIDGSLALDVAISTLRHEHIHAWEFEVGTPSNQEDRANFGATVGDAFDHEFAQQGGRDRFHEIPIEGKRRPVTGK